ncbi:uncharacterized protein K444DRAFT_627573 [Hyaloscypha bicolor E]|uniref:Uncharacterized protein n=1 Tax=Hyaloscypha bicolor E TaxID=1095630 RepID=A0A2J6TI35_9HELO|nr:uncharacterized protein K444DRAFT_627573 [Hyaloscypha bicolor E]PMD62679.1 hypothetical protein K444DRAFT_627573 [Hyaloscypha bicolor E]
MKYPKLPSLFQSRSRTETMGSSHSTSSSTSPSSSSPSAKTTSSLHRRDCPVSARVPVLPITCIRSEEDRGRSLSPRRTTSTDERVSSEQPIRGGFPYYEEVGKGAEHERRSGEKKRRRRFRRSLGAR